MATGCALDVDKNLKNASDIEFFNSETDSHPIRRHRTNVEPEQSGKTSACSFLCSNSTHHDNINMGLFFSGQRAKRDVKGTKMAQYLAEELLDSEGEPIIVKKAVKKRSGCKRNKNVERVKHDIDPGPADDTDSNDGDFLLESSESDSPTDNEPLTNAEVTSTMC